VLVLVSLFFTLSFFNKKESFAKKKFFQSGVNEHL